MKGPEDKNPRLPLPANDAQSAPPRRIDLRELLGESRELRIMHDGQEYRLTLTKLDKLLLTK
ncbi:MAG: hemin uptake protein HemP [Sulfuricella sp.]|nr:hemin uptake protein HemP [Sulfuricella sp.]